MQLAIEMLKWTSKINNSEREWVLLITEMVQLIYEEWCYLSDSQAIPSRNDTFLETVSIISFWNYLIIFGPIHHIFGIYFLGVLGNNYQIFYQFSLLFEFLRRNTPAFSSSIWIKCDKMRVNWEHLGEKETTIKHIYATRDNVCSIAH